MSGNAAAGEVDAATWIAELRDALAQPLDPDVRLDATAQLGVALLERFEQDENSDTLAEAMELLRVAVAADPPLPGVAFLRYAVGTAYRYRADPLHGADDLALAIRWLEHAYLGPHDQPADAVWIAVDLAELYQHRYGLRRYGPSRAEFDPATEARRFVEGLLGLETCAEDPARSDYLRMLRGMALLERYEFDPAPADLDQALALIPPALDALPPDTPNWTDAGENLALACADTYYRDDDEASRERALAMLILALGRAEKPDFLLAQDYGDLRRRRGEQNKSLDDLSAAVYWLTVATDLIEPDTLHAWRTWSLLGRAHQVRWDVGAEPVDLTGVVDAFTRALAYGIPDPDLLLWAHSHLVEAARERLSRALKSDPNDRAGTAAFRRLLADGRDTLGVTTADDPLPAALLAIVLAFGELWVTGMDLGPFDPARARALVNSARAMPESPPEFAPLVDMALGLIEFYEDAPGDDPAAGYGGARFAEAERRDELEESLRGTLSRLQGFAQFSRATRRGDLRSFDVAQHLLSKGSGDPDAEPLNEPERLFFVALTAASRVSQTGDLTAFRELLDQAQKALDSAPISDYAKQALRPYLAGMRQLAEPGLRDTMPATSIDSGSLPVPEGIGAQNGLSLRTLDRIVAVADAIAKRDRSLLHDALDRLAAVARESEAARLPAAAVLGLGYRELARLGRFDAALAQRAVDAQEEAVRLAGGSRHSLWSYLSLGLASAYRLRGDPLQDDLGRSRRYGASALRGHAWQVVLQDGTARAIEAARRAAADALQLANWCLADRSYDELVQALDAGRGLVLHAATSSRRVADQLSDRGHSALAAAWRERGGVESDDLSTPGELRFDVLGALIDPDGSVAADADHAGALPAGAGDLLTPPAVAEIQHALGSVGADALVYLVPASAHFPGAAVIVPSSGSVEVVTLLGLRTDPGTPVDRYLRAHQDRGLVAARTPREFVARQPVGVPGVDEVATWAWDAAIGRLLQHTAGWRLDRPARLVLVPMGALALVPWHAAYTEYRSARRYALADAVFSYIASGRLLCEVASQPDAWPDRALVVGNPTGDLRYAGQEARAIHGAFYPGERYYGQPSAQADASGTPSEVLAWLADQQGSRSILHLACHGLVVPAEPDTSHLVLAGGQRLSVGDIIEAHRLAGLPLDTVFLAACTTGVSGHDYDEALSLATAFLAAGARSAFGSLWPVPDGDTSLLMFMVHHYLRAERRRPADALHLAQLWMLDRHRQPPPTMPDELRKLADQIDADDLLAWAGFTHLGR